MMRPFGGRQMLLSQAESVWWTLEPRDWLEAFATHPKIGAKKLGGWNSQEQSGIESAPKQVMERLAKGNEEYQRRFGWIFLINATGKTAQHMLESLESRLQNESPDELRVAAGEQAQITNLRLNKLFEP